MVRTFPMLVLLLVVAATAQAPVASALNCVEEILDADAFGILRCTTNHIQFHPPPPVGSPPEAYEAWAKHSLSRICVTNSTPPTVYVSPYCGPKSPDEDAHFLLVLDLP